MSLPHTRGEPCDCGACMEVEQERRYREDSDALPTVGEHLVAIRHLIYHYYGPAEYDREADIAIGALAELVFPTDSGEAS